MKKWSETYVNNYKEKHKSEEKLTQNARAKYLTIQYETVTMRTSFWKMIFYGCYLVW